jgi:hypothetical protein
MSEAIHWSASRSAVRNTACERDEKFIERAFERHNSACTVDDCPLSVLESIISRSVQFGIAEDREIVLLSHCGERAEQ